MQRIEAKNLASNLTIKQVLQWANMMIPLKVLRIEGTLNTTIYMGAIALH